MSDSDSEESQQGQAKAIRRDPLDLLQESLENEPVLTPLESRVARDSLSQEQTQGTQQEESEETRTAQRQLFTGSTGQQPLNVRIRGEN